uniref:Jumonji domain-containing protein 4 n=1 Tax=Zosterops lateralis melanops TaxID=1220523 RepID=A0A8D2P5X1_ZOSLA
MFPRVFHVFQSCFSRVVPCFPELLFQGLFHVFPSCFPRVVPCFPGLFCVFQSCFSRVVPCFPELFPRVVLCFPELLFQGCSMFSRAVFQGCSMFCRAFPGRAGYSTPVYFSSDWLNEFWDAAGGDDFRFVYMGPKGSWTPFHADVFRSYSWSANVCGRKRWLLFPPGQEELLRDPRGNLPFDLTAPQLREPGVCPRSRPIPAPLEILQGPGEIVFVPSGWHHQVHNLEDTISINHNWVNGCNVSVVWSFLQEELAAVQRELRQWSRPGEDWPLQCQVQ